MEQSQIQRIRRGIRIIRLEQGSQMVSSGEMADFVTKALETRKPPKLSSSQLEALTIIAYYQPATKAMVEQIRGVDSSYSVAALLNKKLIEEAGRLNVPRRPIQESKRIKTPRGMHPMARSTARAISQPIMPAPPAAVLPLLRRWAPQRLFFQ